MAVMTRLPAGARYCSPRDIGKLHYGDVLSDFSSRFDIEHFVKATLSADGTRWEVVTWSRRWKAYRYYNISPMAVLFVIDSIH